MGFPLPDLCFFALSFGVTVAQFSTVANYFCSAVNLPSQFKIIDNASGVVVCSLSADAARGIVHWPGVPSAFVALSGRARSNFV